MLLSLQFSFYYVHTDQLLQTFPEKRDLIGRHFVYMFFNKHGKKWNILYIKEHGKKYIVNYGKIDC